jgi:hypothetical protein
MRRPRSRQATAQFVVLLALGAASLGATAPQCGTTSVGPDSGANDAGPTADAAAPSDEASSSNDDASSPGDASIGDVSTGDASAGDAPFADMTDAPLGDAAGGDGGSTPTPPTWATWPMPNAPSSGLSNPQSYDTSVAGIALDRVTGLTWQRDYYEVVTQQNASAQAVVTGADAYCRDLVLAGFEDWRLPTRIELASLLDFTTTPAENSSVFSSTSDVFVSSTSHPSTGIATTWQNTDPNGVIAEVIYLSPFMGMLDNGGPVAVRCVRGGTAPVAAHYMVDGGTVHDDWTGLTWIQSPSPSTTLESTVGSYCAAQTLAGGGWRAPSVNELETLWGDSYDPESVGARPDGVPRRSDGDGELRRVVRRLAGQQLLGQSLGRGRRVWLDLHAGRRHGPLPMLRRRARVGDVGLRAVRAVIWGAAPQGEARRTASTR